MLLSRFFSKLISYAIHYKCGNFSLSDYVIDSKLSSTCY